MNCNPEIFHFEYKDPQPLSQSKIIFEKIESFTNIPQEEIIIDYLENGKPYLKNYPEWHISLSHSCNQAVLAINKNPVGIDVEKIKIRKYDVLKIAKRWFHPEEYSWLKEQSPQNQLFFFYKIWTLKEALAKAWNLQLLILLKYSIVNFLEKDFAKLEKLYVNHPHNKSKWLIEYMKDRKFLICISIKYKTSFFI